MSQHAQEPWVVDDVRDGSIYNKACTELIANTHESGEIENAHRIVACVNGCAGLTEEEIKEAVSQFLLDKALRRTKP